MRGRRAVHARDLANWKVKIEPMSATYKGSPSKAPAVAAGAKDAQALNI